MMQKRVCLLFLQQKVLFSDEIMYSPVKYLIICSISNFSVPSIMPESKSDIFPTRDNMVFDI